MSRNDKEQIDTLIGERTRVTGDLHFQGGLHIDGHVDGSVISDGDDAGGTVVVSEVGSVKGTIKAPCVVVNGTVDGDIESSDRVELREKSKVTGNVEYHTIEMKLGATVSGQLRSSGSGGGAGA